MKLDDIFTFENLYKAHKKCRLSKQHKGEVIRFEIDLGTNISKLVKDIHNKTYKVGKYKQFMIYDPKERLIEAPPYKDRVIQMCLCENGVGPRIEKHLINDNVACRKGKGTGYGIERLEKFLKSEYFKENNNDFYYLKCDVKKYFPNINHKILVDKLKKIGFSKEELWLIEKIIKERPNENGVGLPLGNQSSQWFAIFYLDSVDRLIKEKLRIKGYVRYMDDMILLHRDKKYLQKCKLEIGELCSKELRLSLNHKTQIGKVSNGIDFLGYRHILTESGKIVRKLRTSARVRLKRYIKTLSVLEEKGVVDPEYVSSRKNAFYAHIKDTNETMTLKRKLIEKNNFISNEDNVSNEKSNLT